MYISNVHVYNIVRFFFLPNRIFLPTNVSYVPFVVLLQLDQLCIDLIRLATDFTRWKSTVLNCIRILTEHCYSDILGIFMPLRRLSFNIKAFFIFVSNMQSFNLVSLFTCYFEHTDT